MKQPTVAARILAELSIDPRCVGKEREEEIGKKTNLQKPKEEAEPRRKHEPSAGAPRARADTHEYPGSRVSDTAEERLAEEGREGQETGPDWQKTRYESWSEKPGRGQGVRERSMVRSLSFNEGNMGTESRWNRRIKLRTTHEFTRHPRMDRERKRSVVEPSRRNASSIRACR